MDILFILFMYLFTYIHFNISIYTYEVREQRVDI